MKNLLIRAISVGTLSVLASQLVAAPLDVTLHKDPYCGCCVKYAEYLEDHGYNVTMIDHNNMAPVKQRLGTDQAASCHTVEIEGYVVEGHVPVAAIDKLLAERPNIKGIALPGMPYNSPGMGPEKKGSLQVLELDKQGKPSGIYITL